MRPFKVWSLLALTIGLCALPFPSMAQQQSAGFLGGPAGGFLQNIFGYGNNQSAGYPGSAANRPPIYSPNSDYQANQDDEYDDEDQNDGSCNGRLGRENYQGGGGQYGSSDAEGDRGYHGNEGYGDGDPNDSINGGNGQGRYGGNNGGYRRHHHHRHPYGQYGSQGNGSGRAQGRYQNQNSQYDSFRQPGNNNDDGPNY